MTISHAGKPRHSRESGNPLCSGPRLDPRLPGVTTFAIFIRLGRRTPMTAPAPGYDKCPQSDHDDRLPYALGLSSGKCRRSFLIFLTGRCGPSYSTPDSERGAPFRRCRIQSEANAFFLKTNLFCVASLTCGPARALCRSGSALNLRSNSKCARCFTFSKLYLPCFH